MLECSHAGTYNNVKNVYILFLKEILHAMLFGLTTSTGLAV